MKNTTFGIIIGVLLSTIGLLIFMLIHLGHIVSIDHQELAQVVQFLSKSTNQVSATSSAAVK